MLPAFGDRFYKLDFIAEVTQEMAGWDKNWHPHVGLGLLPGAVHSRVTVKHAGQRVCVF